MAGSLCCKVTSNTGLKSEKSPLFVYSAPPVPRNLLKFEEF